MRRLILITWLVTTVPNTKEENNCLKGLKAALFKFIPALLRYYVFLVNLKDKTLEWFLLNTNMKCSVKVKRVSLNYITLILFSCVDTQCPWRTTFCGLCLCVPPPLPSYALWWSFIVWMDMPNYTLHANEHKTWTCKLANVSKFHMLAEFLASIFSRASISAERCFS